VLVLAFDTATDVATTALGQGGAVLGERASRAVRILEDIDGLLADAGLERDSVERIAVGTGPGSYTGLRMGLVTARALSFALEAPVAEVSTLAALSQAAAEAIPLIDGRRSEVFTLADGVPVVVHTERFSVKSGATYVGDGAVRYRALLEERGAAVPTDDDPRHVPWARHHAALAANFGAAELAEPIYLRLPDAERALAP